MIAKKPQAGCEPCLRCFGCKTCNIHAPRCNASK